jgi:hypothetical protein
MNLNRDESLPAVLHNPARYPTMKSSPEGVKPGPSPIKGLMAVMAQST